MVSSNESMTANGNNADAQRSAKRWVTDSAGCKVYYPYGQIRSGYVVTDATRENAIREADRRFDEIFKQFKPYASLLVLPIIFAFYYYVGSHPILAFAIFPALLVLVGLITRLLRSPTLAPLLDGLPRAPAADLAGQKSLHRAAYVILLLIVLIALLLHLYDLRVADADANTRTIDFYPDISKYLIFGSVSTLFLWGVIAGWNKLSAKAGPNRAMLSVFLFSIGSLGFFVAAAWNFYNPQPKIVLSQDTFYCSWRVNWVDIADLSLQASSKGAEYARVKFAANRSPFSDRRLTQSCEIDGLNTNYAEIYDAVQKRWQVAMQGGGAREQMLGLRAKLDQLPLGSSREKVLAVLGQPILTGPSGDGLVCLYSPTQTGDDTSSRRVVAVYFDEKHRVERLATYSLTKGKVVDEISHETLTAGYEYPLLRNVLLNPTRRW